MLRTTRLCGPRIEDVEGRSHKRSVSAWSATLLAIATAGVLSLGGGTALASTVTCGETLTSDTTLRNDLINCAGDGLVVGADNITVNLNSHTVDGDDSSDKCPTGVSSCEDGVNNAAGHSGVTIKHGTIQGFDIGVLAVDANHDVLRALVTSRNAYGILLDHSSSNRIVNGSAADNLFYGMLLFDAANHNEIRRNTVSGSMDTAGIQLDHADQNRVEKNVSEGNDEGIASFGGDNNDFRRNVVRHNLGGAIGADAGVGNRVRENLITANGDGITMGDARDSDISGNIVKGAGTFGAPDTGGFGVILDGGADNTVDRNEFVGGRGPAIFVASLDIPQPPARTVISRNIATSKVYDGIFVAAEATDTRIERNTANRSAQDGIHVESQSTTLISNIANRNHNLGIEAVPGVTDGGGNHAFGNGNPLQCTNIAC